MSTNPPPRVSDEPWDGKLSSLPFPFGIPYDDIPPMVGPDDPPFEDQELQPLENNPPVVRPDDPSLKDQKVKQRRGRVRPGRSKR